MSSVGQLLEDLAGIGATVQPAGEELLLRAGTESIPAELVRRVRQSKRDLIAVLLRSRDSADTEVRFDTGDAQDQVGAANTIIKWLNEHPSPSAAGRCAWCGKAESPDAVVLPFGIEPGTHTWLHAECWPAWSLVRHDEAVRELKASGLNDAARS